MVADTTKTVYVTVTAAATSYPTLTAEQKTKLDTSMSIAQWVAIAVFAAYILFSICIFSLWLRRRIQTRHAEPIKYGLVPEAVDSRGSFLVGGSGKRGARRGTGGSNYSVVSLEEQQRRTRSMFYEGPGTPIEERGPSPPNTSRPISARRHKRYNSSQTNLIALQTPPDSPPVPSLPPKIPLDTPPERPPAGRSRSSSQSTLRYYIPDSPPERMPTLPTVALKPLNTRSGEWQQVPI